VTSYNVNLSEVRADINDDQFNVLTCMLQFKDTGQIIILTI